MMAAYVWAGVLAANADQVALHAVNTTAAVFEAMQD